MKISEYLEKKGIKVEYDGGYYYKCKYKGNKVYLQRNDAFNSCFSLYVNDEIIMTRALLRTIVGKILRLEEVR